MTILIKRRSLAETELSWYQFREELCELQDSIIDWTRWSKWSRWVHFDNILFIFLMLSLLYSSTRFE